MARSRGPRNLVADSPRPEGPADTRAHSDYDAMIAHDLGGRRQTSYRAVDEGGPASAAELLLRPLSLFLLACTAFVIVVTLWLWQAGVFGQLQLNYAERPPVPSSSWMGSRQPRSMRPVDSSEATRSTDLDDAKATAPDAASSDNDAPATQNIGAVDESDD